ncbi:ABC2 type transporter superfamily protein [Chrysochromulina tobinii]|uniref:ABC2 type transporter superfamily protein n=1 Tax=Chrysochromulina tobinii TaxID=1460289 RepID=A0A0M0JAF9_9EUKA|nr:ABC2 type transporter superfamily protein [Chrysochromulina tobinii]|eukprot:KOO23546.1 ABC2 type transporter superfamily protein [Chrysochromulina sp. CCMP291]
MHQHHGLLADHVDGGSVPAINDAGVELKASGVGQTVKVRGAARTILSDVDATFSPGNLTALMGPSGAGKTTLLSILRGGRCSMGSMAIDGAPYTTATRKLIVTVPQDDVLLAGLSPLEMLVYAAHLKLPRALGRAAKLARVQRVLSELNLEGEDQRTRIGSVDARGLSGGQRKRVSIGLELLTNPAVLLCDEPTSGLDAKMAADVVGILRALSQQQRRTVVATIHQPSFQLFARFDWLLLLSKGRVAYSGAALNAAAHFGALGFPTPPHENPADYMMRLLQDVEEARGLDLVAAWAEGAAAISQRAAHRLPSWKPVGVTGRSGSYGDIFSITGALFMCVTTSTLEVLLDTVLEFPLARALLLRELSNGHYSLRSYYVARTVANFWQACVNTVLVALPVYFMVGLSLTARQFGIFGGCLVLLELIGSCIGIMIGCTSNDINDARTQLVPVLAPLLIFSGYVVPYNNIPAYFTWAYYASFFQYSFALLMINEFADRTFTRDCPAQLAEQQVLAALEERLAPYWPPLPHNGTWPAHNGTWPAHNGTWPPPGPWRNWTWPPQLQFTCTGREYLQLVGMWPNKFGAISNYFAILAGYLALAFVATYVVLYRVTTMKMR